MEGKGNSLRNHQKGVERDEQRGGHHVGDALSLQAAYTSTPPAPPPPSIPLTHSISSTHTSDPTLYRRRPQRCPKPTGSSGRTRLRSKCVGLADVWGQLVHHAVCLEVSFMTLVAFPLPSLPSPPLLHSPRLGGDRLPGVCSAPLFPSLSLNSPPSPPFPPLGGDRLSRQAQDMGL